MGNIYHDSKGKFAKSREEPVYIGREKEYKHEWYLKHKEILNKKSKENYQKNKARYALATKIWQSKNKEKVLRYKRKNKDKVRFSGVRQQILERDGYKCQLCNSQEKLVIHHKDGTTNRKSEKNANNEPLNLITLCRSCHILVHKSKMKI